MCHALVTCKFSTEVNEPRLRKLANQKAESDFNMGNHSLDFPGFNDTVEWNLGNPGSLRRGCQEFLRWFWFLPERQQQGRGLERPEIPGPGAVNGKRVDQFTWYPVARQIGNGNLSVVAHFPPDGGLWIDVLD